MTRPSKRNKYISRNGQKAGKSHKLAEIYYAQGATKKLRTHFTSTILK